MIAMDPLSFFLYFLSQLLDGLLISATYALMAVGLTLIFGIMKVVNFAHGEMYMLGGYTSYFIITKLNVNPFPALFVSVIVGFCFGAVVERLLLRPMNTGKVERKDDYSILITFGLSVFLQNFAVVLSPFSKKPPSFIGGKISLGPFTVSGDRLFACCLSVAILLILFMFIYKTATGKALRSVSQNRDAASILGINPFKMDTLAVSLGSLLAAAAGALIAPVYLVYPTMGAFAIKGYVIIVLGGMGSIKGSIVGAILLGVVETLGSVFFPDPRRALTYRDAFGLVALVVVLLLRPTGLFGEKVRKA
ncbi:MAG: branched-chain amino acid ABC transporter permease [Candidatus Bathyarchaeia archaeon]